MITALASVRAAQRRDGEAEELFQRAIELARKSDLKLFERHPLEQLVQFLQDRGREDETGAYEARLGTLSLPRPKSTARIA
jgi:hypothetical protein